MAAPGETLRGWAATELGQAPTPERAEALSAMLAPLRAAVDGARAHLPFEAEPSGFLQALQRWKVRS